ncbi:MAG: hypothetical protein HQL71_07975 [Magnetococcales bacterium]|nr:hypothetical protein [Magnetococcales bacterium]
MFFRLIGWFFKTFTPYILGVLIGVGFFFLLIRFTSGPVGMSWEGDEKTKSSAEKVVIQTPIPTEEKVIPKSVIVKDSNMLDKINAVTQSQAKSRATYQANKELKKTSKSISSTTSTNQILSYSEPDNLKTEVKTKQKTVVAKKNNAIKADLTPKNCGVQPMYQGVERNRFIACQWRNNCLASRLRAKAMFTQERNNCVLSGRNPFACKNYFDSMEKRYDPKDCNRLH